MRASYRAYQSEASASTAGQVGLAEGVLASLTKDALASRPFCWRARLPDFMTGFAPVFAEDRDFFAFIGADSIKSFDQKSSKIFDENLIQFANCIKFSSAFRSRHRSASGSLADENLFRRVVLNSHRGMVRDAGAADAAVARQHVLSDLPDAHVLPPPLPPPLRRQVV